MEIVVEGRKIDTKDIFAIVDIEHYKTAFFNREAGFIIERIEKKDLRFGEGIPYETYPSEIGRIKAKWKKLQDAVCEKWEKDKTELEVFKVE